MTYLSFINLLLVVSLFTFPAFWALDRFYAVAASDPKNGIVYWDWLRKTAADTEPKTHFDCHPERNNGKSHRLSECVLKRLRVNYLFGEAQGPDFFIEARWWICRLDIPFFNRGCDMSRSYVDPESVDRVCSRASQYCYEQSHLRRAGVTPLPPIEIYDDMRTSFREYADQVETAARRYEAIRPFFWVVMMGWALLQLFAFIVGLYLTYRTYVLYKQLTQPTQDD